MLKLLCTVLCFSWVILGSFAALAPFIEKCKWDDRACLVKSTQMAIPYFVAGLPNIGLAPLEALVLDTVSYNEGGLEFVFKDMALTGLKDCNVKDVERNIDENWIRFEAECPVEVNGNYVASGKFFNIPVEGSGRFRVKTDKLLIRMKSRLSIVDGADGQKHWKKNNEDHEYEFLTKTLLKFENLFNGDKERAAPIETILEQSWKEVVQTFGKPIVVEALKQIDLYLDGFFKAVPTSELEL